MNEKDKEEAELWEQYLKAMGAMGKLSPSVELKPFKYGELCAYSTSVKKLYDALDKTEREQKLLILDKEIAELYMQYKNACKALKECETEAGYNECIKNYIKALDAYKTAIEIRRLMVIDMGTGLFKWYF